MLRILVSGIAVGLLGGALAAKWQLTVLRFGEIAADQAFPFWKFFLGSGAAVGVAGAILGALVGRVVPRGRTVVVVLVAAGVVAFAAALFVPGNALERPHVFLLVTDTTRADHLSLYGYGRKTTRYLEEMAGRSVVFNEAMSQGSHTIVTTPSILASLYPSDHGVVDYRSVLWDGFLLVSEMLQREGYATFGTVTNPHLSKRNGFSQGFDVYDMIGSGTGSAVYAERVNARALTVVDSLRGRTIAVPESGSDAGADSAGVDSVGADPDSVNTADAAPIFGFLFYTDPHGPYQAPEEYRKLYDPDWEGPPLFSWNAKKQGTPDGRQMRNLVAQYDAAITYWDDQLRALCDSLEQRDMLESSLLIYTSDHGEEFWEHGNIGHGHALFEEVVHVPLVFSFPVPVRRPRLPRTTRVVSDIVSSVDIVPTLLEYLKIPVEHDMRGRSALAPALGQESQEDRVAFLELLLKQYGTFDLRAIRTRDRKYIVVRECRTQFHTPWAAADMYFDLELDPGEQMNLTRERPEQAARYRDQVLAWIEQSAARQAETFEPDEEHLKELEALGYID